MREGRKDSLESDLSDLSDLSSISDLSSLSDLSEPEVIGGRRHSEPAKLDTVRFLVRPGLDRVSGFHYKLTDNLILTFNGINI